MSYRFALIGNGNMARRQAAHQSLTSVQAAVWDAGYCKVKEFDNQYYAFACNSVDGRLAHFCPDPVCACTPAGLQPANRIQSLETGFQEPGEKPMVVWHSEAITMNKEHTQHLPWFD